MAVTHRVPGAVLTERTHSVPLVHSKPDGEKITIFTRELAAPDGLERPYLLFLQGGPGFEATRRTAVGLAEAGSRRLPGAARRPARHRALDPGWRHPWLNAPGAGRVHDPP